MDTFIKDYTKRYDLIVSQYGFKKRKRVFARIINDVYQNFYVEKLGLYSYGRQCRIGFAVVPLCQKIEAEQALDGMGIYYLRKFEVISGKEIDGWYYRIDPESINACVEEILRYIMNYLLPFFERANSCATALQELIKLEKLFNDNRVAGLKLEGIDDGAEPGAELLISDSAKYFMALKNGDYDFALKSRQALLKQNMAAYQDVQNNNFMTPEKLKKREDNIRNLQEEIQHIEARDSNYFIRIIEQNEAYSRDILKGI